MARRFQLEYRGGRCTICKKTIPEIMEQYGDFKRLFELHHVDRSTKDPDYDNLIRQITSARQLDELDKCVLLCSWCHDIITAQNIDAEIVVTLRYLGMEVSQTLRGNLLEDRKSKASTFITNQRLLLWPYYTQLGRRKPQLTNGIDLDGGQLAELIKATGKTTPLCIWDHRNRPLLRLTRPDTKTIRFEQSVRFPFFQTELQAAGKVQYWLRNGVAVSKDGKISRDAVATIEAKYPPRRIR